MTRLLRLILSYRQEKLPVGLTAYNAWTADIIDLAGPMADKNSMLWDISTMVLHAGSENDRLSKQYFVRRLRKGAANQVASQVIQDIKVEQDKQLKAAESAKAEDTAQDKAACPPTTPA